MCNLTLYSRSASVNVLTCNVGRVWAPMSCDRDCDGQLRESPSGISMKNSLKFVDRYCRMSDGIKLYKNERTPSQITRRTEADLRRTAD